MQVYVLIPAHNEADSIACVVRSCLLHGHRVLVLADHCSDGTAALAREAGADVWEPEAPCGKASALRWAWGELASDPNWTHLLLLDGDGQHDPEEIPRLLGDAASHDLVVGSRAPFQRPMPWTRRWINRIMSHILAVQTGFPIRDSQSGFRIVSRRLVEQGVWTSGRFELESEMVREASRLGMAFSQVPITCRYGGRPSHIQPWHDTWRWLAWWGRNARQS